MSNSWMIAGGDSILFTLNMTTAIFLEVREKEGQPSYQVISSARKRSAVVLVKFVSNVSHHTQALVPAFPVFI